MAKNNFKKRPKVLKDEKFWRFTKKSSLEILRSSANLEVKFHDAKVHFIRKSIENQSQRRQRKNPELSICRMKTCQFAEQKVKKILIIKNKVLLFLHRRRYS